MRALDRIDGRVAMLTCFMSSGGLPPALRARRAQVPTFAFPEQAAIAAARAVEYERWRTRPHGAVPEFPDTRPDEASAIIATALERGPGWLAPAEVEAVLSCYGIPIVATRIARTPEEAGERASELERPLVLKVVGPLHKTDVGGVVLGLRDPEEVARRASELELRMRELGESLEGFLVQEMVEGVEMLVGVTHDDVFGPIVVCGAGRHDRGAAPRHRHPGAPITDVAADEMVRSLATFPLLDGYRGAPPADVSALEDTLLRVSALASERESVMEMDCNPVMVRQKGAVVVDRACGSRLRRRAHEIRLSPGGLSLSASPTEGPPSPQTNGPTRHRALRSRWTAKRSDGAGRSGSTLIHGFRVPAASRREGETDERHAGDRSDPSPDDAGTRDGGAPSLPQELTWSGTIHEGGMGPGTPAMRGVGRASVRDIQDGR